MALQAHLGKSAPKRPMCDGSPIESARLIAADYITNVILQMNASNLPVEIYGAVKTKYEMPLFSTHKKNDIEENCMIPTVPATDPLLVVPTAALPSNTGVNVPNHDANKPFHVISLTEKKAAKRKAKKVKKKATKEEDATKQKKEKAHKQYDPVKMGSSGYALTSEGPFRQLSPSKCWKNTNGCCGCNPTFNWKEEFDHVEVSLTKKTAKRARKKQRSLQSLLYKTVESALTSITLNPYLRTSVDMCIVSAQLNSTAVVQFAIIFSAGRLLQL